MDLFWTKTLMMIYKASRHLPHWDVVYSLHDADDQKYFDFLDKVQNADKR